MNQVFIGRQPIFNRQGQVHAYELLWRANSQQQEANVTDGNQATTEVMLNALMEIGLNRLVGDSLAFINLTRDFILGNKPLPELTGRVVLEILEDIEVDEQLQAAVEKLSTQGYQIALDDFIYTPEWQPLVEIANIIKIDLLALPEDTLRQQVARLRHYPVKLLAEKVEDQAQYELCLELGFDYFQGYFFAKPNTVEGNRTPANKMAILQLLANLANPEISNEELETLIMQDVTLSYRLLRYINSARFAIDHEIDSIRQALMLLGRNTLQHLANLLALSRVSDKPPELIMTALIRARMAELLANHLKGRDSNAYFTAGLFSVLDALMDQSMQDLLEQMPLSIELQEALLNQQGNIGDVLNCVIAYDTADWENAQLKGTDSDILRQTYLDAIDWAAETQAIMG